MVSRETVMGIVGDEAQEKFEEDIYRDFEFLAKSGTHTPTFVYQIFKQSQLLGMPGVALITTYLQQKHQLNNLYVCKSLEAFQQKLVEIQQSPGNSRHALVITNFYEAYEDPYESRGEYVSNVSHKLAIGVEKTDAEIKLVILDSLGFEYFSITPSKLFSSAKDLLQASLSEAEAILWYLCRALNRLHSTVYYSAVRRQRAGYGCETFAIKDAISFLRDPEFFNKIETVEVKIKQKTFDRQNLELNLQEITNLPPEFMKGTQSFKLLEDYYEKYLKDRKIEPLSLKQHIEKHTIEADQRRQNYYINRQSFKYHLFVLAALQTMKEEEIQQLIQQTLLRAYRPYVAHPHLRTLSDLHQWNQATIVKRFSTRSETPPLYSMQDQESI